MIYIFYKIINNFLFRKLIRIRPLIFYKRAPLFLEKKFRIDLLHSTTHLGDKLFFLKLIRLLSLLKIEVELIDDGFIEKMYLQMYGESFNAVTVGSEAITIIPKPSYLNKFKKYKRLYVVDFTDITVKKVIADQLVDSFCEIFHFKNEVNLQFRPLVKKNYDDINLKHGRYVIFNNYIDSGYFRKYFVNEKKLFLKCEYLKKNDFKIIHVGSRRDKLSDSRSYPFVDIDLRGKISIQGLAELISLEQVKEVVTFDNFVMHLALLYKKNVSVLFRGRFTKTQREHHYRYVNCTFSDRLKKLICYM